MIFLILICGCLIAILSYIQLATSGFRLLQSLYWKILPELKTTTMSTLINSGLQIKVRIWKSFLYFSIKTYVVALCDSSFEHPQRTFNLMDRKISFAYQDLCKYNLLVFSSSVRKPREQHCHRQRCISVQSDQRICYSLFGKTIR